MIASIHNGRCKLISRNQNDWTNKFPTIVEELNQLFNFNLILDGEIVILDEHGHSNFQLLQNSIKENRDRPFIYYVFDILYYDSYDLTELTLLERKNILQQLITATSSTTIRYSDHIIGLGDQVFAKVCHLDLEGIVSKNIDSIYTQSRTRSWLKTKCMKRQEFVIAGYTQPQGKRKHFGSLLLGTYNQHKELIYNGNVGTGFTEATLAEIYKLLQKYQSKKMPFSKRPPGSSNVTWLTPVLVGEVEFSEWTNEGYVRHPSFKGLRNDKSPQNIIREKEVHVSNTVTSKRRGNKAQPTSPSSFNYRLTNPNKILYPEDKITKQQFAAYYEAVSDRILPYIVKRALTIVRCPGGYQGECFYQKHVNKTTPKALHGILVKEKTSKSKCIYIDDQEGLLALAQIGALEIHPWGSRIETIEYPDVLVFDLDPAPDVPWASVVQGAYDVKNLLMKIKLKSFVKTTGGKGLHVVVPIQPKIKWDDIKIFTHVVADYLVKQNPTAYVDQMTKSKRTGKVFVDYLRNQRGATAIAPYSTRARRHAPVAVPLAWDELTDDFADTFYTLQTLPQRLYQLRKDPWHDFFKIKQSLELDKLKI